jgi:ABC-type multidrug transport system ATPase subunit
MTAEKFDQSQDGRLEVCEGKPVVLSTHGLTKDFKKLRAVDDLSISVCRGDVFGFLGPNGSGKTTTIRMIFGLIYPTKGYAQVLDQGAAASWGLRGRPHVLWQHVRPP